jgi:probable phosphoglycerate mutase
MKLILTRHGETEENKKHIIQGHLPGTLSFDGIEQGRKLAERLKDENIDAIFSSDLKRASDTARMIAKFHPGVEVVYTEKLREGDAGSFTGQSSREVDWSNRPADAETTEQMQKRASDFLEEVFKQYPDKTVLFVGHNGINKSFITYIQNLPHNHLEKIDNQENTAVNIFEICEDKNHKTHLLNCTRHLGSK